MAILPNQAPIQAPIQAPAAPLTRISRKQLLNLIRGRSTPRVNEGNPDRVSLADYERLKDVVKRLSDEKSAAYVEIDLLVKDNKDLKKREEDLLEHQADLSILDMEGGKSTKVPPFTGTDKDEYSADIWLTNVARLGELNNWKDEQILNGCLLALKDVASVWRESELRLGSTSLTTWARFQEAFKSRFQEAKSAVEQVSIISNLKQGQKEVYGTILTGLIIPSI